MKESHKTDTRRGMNTPLHTTYGDRIDRILQATRDRVHRAARLARDNPTRRSLLKMLSTNPNGVTYRDLFATLPVSERWVRELVADLRREGVVETPGSPALIQFTARDVELAVREVLSFLAVDWIETTTSTGPSDHPHDTPTNHHTETYLKTMTRLIRG